MQQNSQISFDISSTDAYNEDHNPIALSVFIDKECVFHTDCFRWAQNIQIPISDEDNNEHELRVEISGKTPDHTVIDAQGNILKDIVIELSNFTVDGIDINQLFQEKTVYTHNFNGTKDTIEDQFFGIAGCNGTISFRFTTPIYLWLLENM